jgi:hypothetical protein
MNMPGVGFPLGVIADDFTGAIDVAVGLYEAGLRTTVLTQPKFIDRFDVDAVVIALKTRSCNPDEATRLSVESANELIHFGANQIYFKYCSTFDSTKLGNIGPVADALSDLLESPLTVIAPAYPANNRTVSDGNLFINSRLLSESHMRHHPLNPMTNSNLVELIEMQSKYSAGNVKIDSIRAQETESAFQNLRASGKRYAVVDTLADNDLDILAKVCKFHKFLTGSAGLIAALAKQMNFPPPKNNWILPQGRNVILSGSCSEATLSQVSAFSNKYPSMKIDPLGRDLSSEVDRICEWFEEQDSTVPVLISSSVSSIELSKIQHEFGVEESSLHIEKLFGVLAGKLVGLGAKNILVAGGETSGSVTKTLNVKEMNILAPISVGVAWASTDINVNLALKSGNFGSETIFSDAFSMFSRGNFEN